MTSTQCLPIVQEIESLKAEIASLQGELGQAAPSEKSRIAQQIAELRTAVTEAQLRLSECESTRTTPESGPGVLGAGGHLGIDGSLLGPGGFVRLVMQPDGNLVIYARRSGGEIPRWASGTAGMSVTTCVMQTDGNLVLYNGSHPVWSSGTISPGAHLFMQDDENLVIYQGSTPLWASATSLDGKPVKGDGPKVYHVFQGVRHWIPDPETLEARFGGWGSVTTVLDGELILWPEGDPVPSVKVQVTENIHVCVDPAVSGPAHPPRELPPAPPPRILPDGSIVGVSQAPLTGVTEKMWPVGAILSVSMTGGSAFVRSKVRQWADEWSKYGNIRFSWVDRDGIIRITFDLGHGSWSMVGRDALWAPFGVHTMNYGWLEDSTRDAEFERVVMHEFGHALGLIHEHQSPTAGIAWDREKTYDWFAETQGWDRAKVDADVFDRYSVQHTNYSAFDPDSIMEYTIPPELTLDHKGVAGGVSLSPTDRDYIARWYPFPPTPTAASGLLRTGDDCDEIDFLVEYGAAASEQVEFALNLASGLTWWKAIEIPVGAGGYSMFEMGRTESGSIPVSEIDTSRPIRFWKAKGFGVHTLLDYTWDVLTALPGGSRLNLTWKRDRC
jgi:serralysin